MGKEHTEDDIRNKMLAYNVRVTTRLSGSDKNAFMLDLLKRGFNESYLASNIIKLHYSIIKENHELVGKEFSELKKYILEKISL